MKHRYLRSIAQGVNRARARGGEGGVEVSTHNLNVSSFRSLVTPRELKAELPHTAGTQMTVSSGRAIVRAILEGHDPRFLAIVGPCSVHDVAAAREYPERLAALATQLAARLISLMR